VGFNVWRGRGIPAQSDGTVGFGHWTLVVPDAATLAAVAERLRAIGAPAEPHPEGLLSRDPSGIAVVVTEQEQGEDSVFAGGSVAARHNCGHAKVPA
jgi:catechol-2,3-dioxygenase